MSETSLTRPNRPSECRRTRAALAIAAAALLTVAGCASSRPEPDTVQAEPSAPTTSTPPAQEEPPGREAVKPTAPVRYTVQRGDTLWDIAAKFLRDPWVWPEVWQVNPQIENPHLIYPGDVIMLTWAGDQPRLSVRRPGGGGGNVKRLKPRVRRQPLDAAIASIPADAIRQFLNRPEVATAEEIESAPYVLGNYEGRLISAAGSQVFAKGFPEGRPDARKYYVVRPGEALRDPATGDLLGYELIYAGDAEVRQPGPPARLALTASSREILDGDRLIKPRRQPAQARYVPTVPDQSLDGQIIHLVDAISQVGTNQVVVVNLGEQDGLEIGHVLGIEQSGGTVNDPHVDGGEDARVELPPQRVGTMMVFHTFDRLAYALVLDATQAIHLHDSVVRP